MSKMYMLNRMTYAPAAGGFLGSAIKFVGKLFGKGKNVVQQVVPQVLPAAKKLAPYVAPAAIVAGAELLGGGGGSGGGGASGGWSGTRRRRGITATELRGYRKVANLIHKEGMVSRRARGRKHD